MELTIDLEANYFRRGRGTVEHILIFAKYNRRGSGIAEHFIHHLRELREGILLRVPKEPLETHGELRNSKQDIQND